MHQRLNALFLLTAAVLCSLPRSSPADSHRDLLALDIDTLLTIEVTPSADASGKGLRAPFAGGQVADSGRIGLLGTQPVLTTPVSVTSYTADFIRNQQAASVGDVLQYDPTVRVARGFGNFQQVYLMRGLPLFSDDMAYNGLYGILPRQYLAAELIERVDVLRGANAVLNNATLFSGLGGAINVMPKRAPLEDLTRLTLGTQTGGQGYAAADLSRRSDDKRFGLRLNAVTRQGDTAVDNESRQLDLATMGFDFRGHALRISADFGYQNHRMDSTTPSFDIAPGLAIPDAPEAESAIAQPWTYSNERDLFGTLRAEYDFSHRITGWIALGLRRGEEESSFTSPLQVTDSGGTLAAGRFDTTHEDNVTNGDAGVRLQFETGAIAHRLTLSANAFDNDARNAYAIFDGFTSNLYQPVAVPPPSTLIFTGGDQDDPRVTVRTRISSVAIADESTWLDGRLLLTLGVRKQSIDDFSYDYDTGERLTHYYESALPPMAGLVYRIREDLSAYLHYSEAMQKGDIAPATNGNGPVANAGESLEPYHARETELGLKYVAGTLGYTAGLFEIRKPVPGYDRNNALVEKDRQTHRGLELTLFGAAWPGLNILGGASRLDTDLNGQETIGAPRTQANLNLEWSVPGLSPQPDQGLILTGQIVYTGAQFADTGNLQKVPDWTRLDLGARHTTPLAYDQRLILHARLENVAGKDYWASSGGYPGEGYLTLGGPRTLLVSATLEF